jgi:manganese/zinc/iron transport system substrate-binding protein
MKQINIILIIGLCSIAIYYFKQQDPAIPADIVCTTTILADTCKSLVGSSLRVTSLMGPGIDPHLYQARPSDIHTLKNARMIIYHGLHLEGKIANILEELSNSKKVLDVSRGCDASLLRKTAFTDLYDPHIWHDIVIWIDVVHYIAQQLQKVFPLHAKTIHENTAKYIQELYSLHEEVSAMIKTIPADKRTLITAHDAFWYFGKRYGLEVIGLQGLSTDAGITIQDIEKVANLIVSKNIPTIFVETSIAQRSLQAVRQAVQARNVEVQLGNELYSDALGTPYEKADTYVAMMLHNTSAIMEGLKQ